MENKLNFIVLPKEEIMLTNDEAAMLLGGDNCYEYTICTHPEGHGSACNIHNNEPCKGGGCGETMHCQSRGTVFSCPDLGCFVKV